MGIDNYRSRLADRAARAESRGRSQDFTLAQNADLTIAPSGWAVRTIGVSNLTPFWVQVQDAPPAYQWVLPNSMGAMVPVREMDRVRVTSKSVPATIAAAITASTLKADLTAFEDAFAPSPGIPVASGSARATAFPSLSRGVATYTFIPPNLVGIRGIIIYVAVTAGGGTVTTSLLESDTTLTGGNTITLVATLGIASGAGAQVAVYPGLPVTANSSNNWCIGQTPTISCVVTVAAATFQVDYDLLP